MKLSETYEARYEDRAQMKQYVNRKIAEAEDGKRRADRIAKAVEAAYGEYKDAATREVLAEMQRDLDVVLTLVYEQEEAEKFLEYCRQREQEKALEPTTSKQDGGQMEPEASVSGDASENQNSQTARPAMQDWKKP